MYLDDYNDEIIKLLRKQFHKDNVARLYPMIARYYNTLKKIVNLKSVIYKQEAERQWYKNSDKKIDDKYEQLMSKSNIDTTMQLTNKLTNVNNTSFVRIIPDIVDGVIKYASVPSELVSVLQDPNDPSEITAILHRVCTHDSYIQMTGISCNNDRESTSYTSKYFYWDKDNYLILDSDRKPIYQEKNPDNKNPYGVIPYVMFSNMPSISGSIWNETVNDDLYSGTLQVNVLQTYLNNAIKLLGYKQLFISGMSTEESKKLNASVSDALQPITATDSNAKITAVEMTNGVTDIRESIHDVMSEIADNHGVSFNARTQSASKSSGLALAIEQEQVDNIRDEQIPLYRQAEKKLSERTVIIANKDLKAGISEGTLSINFYEDNEQVPIKDQILKDQFDLKNNLKSIVDLYKESDPDVIDDKDAIKRLNENKQLNDALLPSFSLGMEEDEPEEDDVTE